VSIVLPAGLAGSGRGSQIPRTEGQELAYWEQAPGHTVLELEGYLLQGKANAPRVYVYPAMEYAQMVAGAFESIHRLDNILYGPRAPISPDQLPAVPFFNGKPAFSAQIQTVSFQNGSGVRFLTEYAEYAVSGNNQDLFYHFEGLTRDGTYYIVAILPISHPKLAETSDGGAALPPGGIPYPYFADPQTDMRGYYREVTTLLDDALPGDFSPSIEQLDQLILSMRVIP
jgi:hypothetical protein